MIARMELELRCFDEQNMEYALKCRVDNDNPPFIDQNTTFPEMAPWLLKSLADLITAMERGRKDRELKQTPREPA